MTANDTAVQGAYARGKSDGTKATVQLWTGRTAEAVERAKILQRTLDGIETLCESMRETCERLRLPKDDPTVQLIELILKAVKN